MLGRAMRKPSEHKILPGVTVTRSAEGSVSVVADGRAVGWLHASSGDQWVAVVMPGYTLGKYRLDAAAQAIVNAFHEKSA